MVLPRPKAHRCQGFHGGLGAGPGRKIVAVVKGKLDIFQGGGPGQEIETLEDETDLLIADLGQFVPAQTGDIRSFQKVLSLGGAVQAAQMFMKVDFPDPEAPMMAINSPAGMVRSTPLRAGTCTSPR